MKCVYWLFFVVEVNVKYGSMVLFYRDVFKLGEWYFYYVCSILSIRWETMFGHICGVEWNDSGK